MMKEYHRMDLLDANLGSVVATTAATGGQTTLRQI